MKNRNFNEIYKNILIEKDPILDILRRRKLISGILIFAILIAIALFIKVLVENIVFMVIAFALVACNATIYIMSSTQYRSIYKKTVIANLVKQYCSTLQFENKMGVSPREYDRANYREYYDRFHSEDLIYGNIDDEFYIRMSEVKAEREEVTTDSEGHTQTHYVTVFQGLFGFIDVNDKFLPQFEVSSNKFFGKYSKSRIEVDSAEFEKSYDLYTEDKIRTMEIFTADLIEKFIEFKQNLNNPIQIKIVNGILFFRVRMNNSFEAPTFGKALDFNSMYHNFKLIDEPIKLLSGIFKNAKDIQTNL